MVLYQCALQVRSVLQVFQLNVLPTRTAQPALLLQHHASRPRLHLLDRLPVRAMTDSCSSTTHVSNALRIRTASLVFRTRVLSVLFPMQDHPPQPRAPAYLDRIHTHRNRWALVSSAQQGRFA